MSNSNDILLGYSPGDFFYERAKNNGTMPTKEQCDNLDIYNVAWDNKCNVTNYPINAVSCNRKELCKNRSRVHWLINNKSSTSGSTQKYLDINHEYNNEVLTTINLGVGLLLLSGFIIKNTYYNI